MSNDTMTSTPVRPVASDATAPGAKNGARYLEGLRDGREVWYRGQRVSRM